MCVIIACDKTRPTIEILRRCEEENPHGGGISWRQDGKVHFKKGLDAMEINSIAMKVSLPFVIHFRIATAGGNSPEMCHPFPIGGSLKMSGASSAVLFHNGHWNDWEDVFLNALVSGRDRRLPNGPISDTRALSILMSWYGKNMVRLVKGQRFVYFSESEMELYGYWQEHGGMQFSNMMWNYGNHRSYANSGYNWQEHYRQGGGHKSPNTSTSHYTGNACQAAGNASTALVPAGKSAKESAEAFLAGRETAKKHLGVTEEELADLEKEYGVQVDARGNLVSIGNQSAEEYTFVPASEVAGEDEKVVVATFGENNEPITAPNS